MKRFLLALVAMLLVATPAWSAAWTASWSKTTITDKETSYILLPTSTDAGETVTLKVHAALFSVCMDTNHATAPGVSEGAGTVQVVKPTTSANTAVAGTAVATLTSANPCAHNLRPGTWIFRVSTTTTSAGGLVAWAY